MDTAYEAFLVIGSILASFFCGLFVPFLAKAHGWNIQWSVAIAVGIILIVFSLSWFEPWVSRRATYPAPPRPHV
jgi:Na+/melibiose symporter-like transporter